jgi:hypothetical protein
VLIYLNIARIIIGTLNLGGTILAILKGFDAVLITGIVLAVLGVLVGVGYWGISFVSKRPRKRAVKVLVVSLATVGICFTLDVVVNIAMDVRAEQIKVQHQKQAFGEAKAAFKMEYLLLGGSLEQAGDKQIEYWMNQINNHGASDQANDMRDNILVASKSKLESVDMYETSVKHDYRKLKKNQTNKAQIKKYRKAYQTVMKQIKLVKHPVGDYDSFQDKFNQDDTQTGQAFETVK